MIDHEAWNLLLPGIEIYKKISNHSKFLKWFRNKFPKKKIEDINDGYYILHQSTIYFLFNSLMRSRTLRFTENKSYRNYEIATDYSPKGLDPSCDKFVILIQLFLLMRKFRKYKTEKDLRKINQKIEELIITPIVNLNFDHQNLENVNSDDFYNILTLEIIDYYFTKPFRGAIPLPKAAYLDKLDNRIGLNYAKEIIEGYTAGILYLLETMNINIEDPIKILNKIEYWSEKYARDYLYWEDKDQKPENEEIQYYKNISDELTLTNLLNDSSIKYPEFPHSYFEYDSKNIKLSKNYIEVIDYQKDMVFKKLLTLEKSFDSLELQMIQVFQFTTAQIIRNTYFDDFSGISLFSNLVRGIAAKNDETDVVIFSHPTKGKSGKWYSVGILIQNDTNLPGWIVLHKCYNDFHTSGIRIKENFESLISNNEENISVVSFEISNKKFEKYFPYSIFGREYSKIRLQRYEEDNIALRSFSLELIAMDILSKNHPNFTFQCSKSIQNKEIDVFGELEEKIIICEVKINLNNNCLDEVIEKLEERVDLFTFGNVFHIILFSAKAIEINDKYSKSDEEIKAIEEEILSKLEKNGIEFIVLEELDLNEFYGKEAIETIKQQIFNKTDRFFLN